MCRHLGYVGPPVTVGELLVRGPHSLFVQSWAPRRMRGGGTVNADGFGAAWWRRANAGIDDVRHTVSRYRNSAPIWTDPAVEEVLGQLESHAVVAAVRSATVGMPIERGACAPFTDEHWAFSHNGLVPAWRAVLPAVAADLDATLDAPVFRSPAILLEAESLTDSAALWVLLRGLLETLDPAEALTRLTGAVLRHAPEARLNLLLGNGIELWATTVYHSLSALATDDAAVLSSEPYDDDPRWQTVPDRSLVTAVPGRLTVTDLPALERSRT
ncbi:ergothioneine biosynthesis protein EgtC [Nocardia thailandica]